MTDWPRDDPDAPGAVIEPVPAGREPAGIAGRFLRGRLVVDVVALVVGGLLLGTGIGGVTYLSRQLDHLARTGVLATATAVGVDNYHSRFQVDEHVTVTFRVHERVVRASAYLNPGDQLVVGEPVVVVYDPADPTRAQLATNPSFGPAGIPFFAAVLAGVVVALPGAVRLYLRRGAGAAVLGPGRDVPATRSTRRRFAVDGSELRLRGQVGRLPRSVVLRVFGGREPGAVLVGVATGTRAVVYGRVPKATE